MVSKTCVVIFIGVALFVAIQTWFPTASAVKRTSGIDEFMAEIPRGVGRHYVDQTIDNEYSDLDYVGPKYALDPPRPAALPEFMVDYADMIRNDIMLLDNSLQTRTRQTGNVKVKKQNQALPGVPCKCEIGSETINLTKDWGIVYPYIVRNITCSDVCVKPYTCQRKIYNITILKRRPETLTMNGDYINKLNDGYDMPLPNELVRRWIPKTIPITTGCHCTLI